MTFERFQANSNNFFDSTMSWPYYPQASAEEEEDFNYGEQNEPTNTSGASQQFADYAGHYDPPLLLPQQLYSDRAQYFQQMQQLRQQQQYHSHLAQQTSWTQQAVISPDYVNPQQATPLLPQYPQPLQYPQQPTVPGPSGTQAAHLYPHISRPTVSRSASFASDASSKCEVSHSDASRGVSPNVGEMARWGTKNRDDTWSCSYPGCKSTTRFSRGCDLRKHYKRHTKTVFCRYADCPASVQGGFSSKKDRDRHEQKHDPQVTCSEGCGRKFSREDNMRDHVRRMHGRSGGRGRS